MDYIDVKKDLSRFLQKRPNIYLAKILPLSIYKKYLQMMGFYYYSVHSDERKTITESFKYIFGNKKNTLAFYYHLLKTYNGIFNHYFEKMINAHKSLSSMMEHLNKKIKFSGKPALDRILSTNKGCILITGHFGAVEYIPLFLASNNYRASMILRFKTEQLRETLFEKSKSVDLELIDAESPNVLFRALSTLREGRVLITLCDEIDKWRPSRREHTEIFGHHVPRDRTLDILFKRSQAPLCFGLLLRSKPNYQLIIHEMSKGDDDFSACERSWKILEQYVYKHPDQWYQWPSFYPEFNRYLNLNECYEY